MSDEDVANGRALLHELGCALLCGLAVMPVGFVIGLLIA